MARNTEKSNNLQIAGVFLLLVIGLILLSIIVKIVLVVKNSQFDGNHRFTVGLTGDRQSKIISFSPQNKSISILYIKESIQPLDLVKFLQVPIDSAAVVKESQVTDSNIALSLIKSGFEFKFYSELTPIDVLRLALFARTVPKTSITEKTISKSATPMQRNDLSQLLFLDQAINQENAKIEIVNATNVFNLGGRLANILENIGCNVILVSTAKKTESKSRIIYHGKESYTIRKLNSFLNFPKEKSDKTGVSDVIIVIGSDSLAMLRF